MVGKKAQA